MSPKVFTIRLDKRAVVVEEIMNWAHVRHVPVVDAGGRLVGLISQRDILRVALSEMLSTPMERRVELGKIPVAKAMKSDVLTIGPDDPVQEAARRMRAHKYGCLPVVEGGKLVGIISEHDLLGVVEQLPHG
jgi:CBS domain-containing membrane protein